MKVKRVFLVPTALCLGFSLGSCSPMAGFTSDLWPHWAGGLPAGAPPRPGAPGYDEYIAHQEAKTEPAKPAAANATAPAVPAAAPPPDDAAGTEGGLY